MGGPDFTVGAQQRPIDRQAADFFRQWVSAGYYRPGEDILGYTHQMLTNLAHAKPKSTEADGLARGIAVGVYKDAKHAHDRDGHFIQPVDALRSFYIQVSAVASECPQGCYNLAHVVLLVADVLHETGETFESNYPEGDPHAPSFHWRGEGYWEAHKIANSMDEIISANAVAPQALVDYCQAGANALREGRKATWALNVSKPLTPAIGSVETCSSRQLSLPRPGHL